MGCGHVLEDSGKDLRKMELGVHWGMSGGGFFMTD